MTAKIKIEHLDKYYGSKQALKDVNLTIESGMFGLLGRNGAGKTTLMKVLATLIRKQNGEVSICGIPVEDTKRIRKITGYLPQEFSMYPNMTAVEALEYMGTLSGIEPRKLAARIDPVLKMVNLQDDHRTKVKEMSGGMKRRLGDRKSVV